MKHKNDLELAAEDLFDKLSRIPEGPVKETDESEAEEYTEKELTEEEEAHLDAGNAIWKKIVESRKETKKPEEISHDIIQQPSFPRGYELQIDHRPWIIVNLPNETLKFPYVRTGNSMPVDRNKLHHAFGMLFDLIQLCRFPDGVLVDIDQPEKVYGSRLYRQVLGNERWVLKYPSPIGSFGKVDKSIRSMVDRIFVYENDQSCYTRNSNNTTEYINNKIMGNLVATIKSIIKQVLHQNPLSAYPNVGDIQEAFANIRINWKEVECGGSLKYDAIKDYKSTLKEIAAKILALFSKKEENPDGGKPVLPNGAEKTVTTEKAKTIDGRHDPNHASNTTTANDGNGEHDEYDDESDGRYYRDHGEGYDQPANPVIPKGFKLPSGFGGEGGDSDLQGSDEGAISGNDLPSRLSEEDDEEEKKESKKEQATKKLQASSGMKLRQDGITISRNYDNTTQAAPLTIERVKL